MMEPLEELFGSERIAEMLLGMTQKIGAIICMYTVSWFVVKNVECFRKLDDPWNLFDLVFSLPFYPVLSYFALAGASGLSESPTTRWTGVSYESSTFLQLYTAKSIVHFFVLFMQGLTPSFLCSNVIHHLVTITCCLNILRHGMCYYFCCLDGCCEVTNVFLTFLYVLKGTKTDKKYTTAYAVNGFCLWAGFVVFRMVLFPYMLFQYIDDTINAPYADMMDTFSWAFNPFVTIVLFFLSITWFIPITKGFMKVVFKKDDGWQLKKQE